MQVHARVFTRSFMQVLGCSSPNNEGGGPRFRVPDAPTVRLVRKRGAEQSLTPILQALVVGYPSGYRCGSPTVQ